MQQNSRRNARLRITLAAAALLWASSFAGEVAAQGAAPAAPAAPAPVAAAPAPAPAAQTDDCTNARYVALANTPFSGMGEKEFEDFVLMDAKCRAHERATASCAHKRYTDLLAKKPADMTKREYDYFVAVDRECSAAGGTPQAPATRPSGMRQLFTGAAVLIAIVATAIASGS